MEELLSRLYSRLTESFEENIKKESDKKRENDGALDVLKTLLSLSVNQKTMHEYMHKGAISIDELKCIDKESYYNCKEKKFIVEGKGVYSNKVFLGLNGIFEYYKIKNLNFRDAFLEYDLKNFPIIEYKLKAQEKIWCIFLILMGADSKNKKYDTDGFSPKKLTKNHKFLIKIEEELAIKGINLGGKIGWESGKDINFRKFITNNVQLPKTGLYSKDGTWKYYLNLESKKNATLLMDLILNEYNGAERISINDIFNKVLNDLNYSLNDELNIVPPNINQNILEVLRG